MALLAGDCSPIRDTQADMTRSCDCNGTSTANAKADSSSRGWPQRPPRAVHAAAAAWLLLLLLVSCSLNPAPPLLLFASATSSIYISPVPARTLPGARIGISVAPSSPVTGVDLMSVAEAPGSTASERRSGARRRPVQQQQTVCSVQRTAHSQSSGCAVRCACVCGCCSFTPEIQGSSEFSIDVQYAPIIGQPLFLTWLSGENQTQWITLNVNASAAVGDKNWTLMGSLSGADALLYNTPSINVSTRVDAPSPSVSLHGGGPKSAFNFRTEQDGDSMYSLVGFGDIRGITTMQCCAQGVPADSRTIYVADAVRATSNVRHDTSLFARVE